MQLGWLEFPKFNPLLEPATSLPREAVDTAVDMTAENKILHVIPTYSAMLEVREIITGRKIL